MSRPHSPAALTIALSRAHSRWQTVPTGQPPRHPPRIRLITVTSDHVPSIAPSPRPSPRHTEKFGTAPSSPLDRVLARYRPAVRSCRCRCAALNYGAVRLTGVRRAPPLPLPSGAYKRVTPSTPLPRTGLIHPSFPSPRAIPCPTPASATPLSPRPISIHGSATVFSLSGKPFPLFSLPLWLCSKQLARPMSFATLPRVWNTTPLPQSLPGAHRRRLPPRSSATSSRTAPSRPPLAKLSPPLGSPAPPRAKAPTRCPRTGSLAVNRCRAHRRPGSPRRRPVHPTVDRWRRPPLLLSLACGPRGDAVPLTRPRRLLPWAATGPAHSRCAWLGQNPRHGPPELKPFFFFLFQPFLL
jgi:hypothetical protein